MYLNELNDLIRDLSLSKESSGLFASRLAEKIYSHVVQKLHFIESEKSQSCILSRRLMLKMGFSEYSADDSCVFIDSSKRSLKCVLLHNDNKFSSIPIAYSTKMKKAYTLVMKKVKYSEY